MDAKIIKRDLEQAAGGALVSIEDICRWSGHSRDYVKLRLVRDVPSIRYGRDRLYFAGDVAASIAKQAIRD